MLAQAENVANFMRSGSAGNAGGDLGPEVLDLGYRQLAGRYEPDFGGFGEEPKFPTPQYALTSWVSAAH